MNLKVTNLKEKPKRSTNKCIIIHQENGLFGLDTEFLGENGHGHTSVKTHSRFKLLLRSQI